MRKTRLKFLALVFVPVTGLLSCAKEKPQDNFTLATPTVQIQTGEGFTTRQLAARLLPSTSRLVFKDLESANFDQEPVTFKIQSICENQLGTASAQTTHQNVSQIRLQDLVPSEVLGAKNSDPSLISCTITIQASNKFNSQYNFSPVTFKFTQSAQDSDWDLSKTLTQSQQPTSDEVDFEAFRVNTEIKVADTTHFYLACEGFTAKIDDAQKADWKLTTQIKSYTVASLVDPSQKSKQLCRLIRETLTGSRKLEMSALQPVQFSITRPVVRQDEDRFLSGFLSENEGEWARHPSHIQRFFIDNPTDETMHLAAPAMAMQSLHVQAVSDVPDRLRTVNVRLDVDGSTTKIGDLILFDIPPRGSRKINAVAHINYGCLNPDPRNFRYNAQQALRGFYYKVEEDVLAVMLPQGTGAKITAQTDRATLIKVPLIRNRVQQVEGMPDLRWAPFYKKTGALPEPGIDPAQIGAQSNYFCRWY